MYFNKGRRGCTSEDLEAEMMLRNLVINDTPYVPPAKPVAERRVCPDDAASVIQNLTQDNEALFELLRHCIGVDGLCQYCVRRDMCRELSDTERTRNVFWTCINGCNFMVDTDAFPH